MSLGYKLRQANRRLEDLTPRETRDLERLLQAVYRAETDLLARAAVLMDRCIGGCRGLCCRNVAIDEIIGFADLVYIVGRHPDLRNRLAACLAAERPFFTVDCPFLENGHGPCILPEAVRPEVCITTFCADTGPVRREISQVRRAFMRLGWFLGRVTIHQALRRTVGRFSPHPDSDP